MVKWDKYKHRVLAVSAAATLVCTLSTGDVSANEHEVNHITEAEKQQVENVHGTKINDETDYKLNEQVSQVSDDNAPALLPGDFFYFVKLLQEKVYLILALDDTEQAKLLAEFAQERLREAEALIREGKEELARQVLQKALDQQMLAMDMYARQGIGVDAAEMSIASGYGIEEKALAASDSSEKLEAPFNESAAAVSTAITQAAAVKQSNKTDAVQVQPKQANVPPAVVIPVKQTTAPKTKAPAAPKTVAQAKTPAAVPKMVAKVPAPAPQTAAQAKLPVRSNIVKETEKATSRQTETVSNTINEVINERTSGSRTAGNVITNNRVVSNNQVVSNSRIQPQRYEEDENERKGKSRSEQKKRGKSWERD